MCCVCVQCTEQAHSDTYMCCTQHQHMVTQHDTSTTTSKVSNSSLFIGKSISRGCTIDHHPYSGKSILRSCTIDDHPCSGHLCWEKVHCPTGIPHPALRLLGWPAPQIVHSVCFLFWFKFLSAHIYEFHVLFLCVGTMC